MKNLEACTKRNWVLQQAGWQSDEIWARLEILKTCYRSKYLILALFNQATALFQQI